MPFRAAASENSVVYLAGEIESMRGLRPIAVAADETAWAMTSAPAESGEVAMTISLPVAPASLTSFVAAATSSG